MNLLGEWVPSAKAVKKASKFGVQGFLGPIYPKAYRLPADDCHKFPLSKSAPKNIYALKKRVRIPKSKRQA
jgi:hypothetical protein